jgi:DNA-binding NarL/FixJ family response regulator
MQLPRPGSHVPVRRVDDVKTDTAGGVREVSDRGERAALYRELLEREHRLQELIVRLLDHEQDPGRWPPLATPPAPIHLTGREVEILRLLVTGGTNREIGVHLCLRAGTVRNYLGRIFRKLGVTTRTQAAVCAIELGLVTADDRAATGLQAQAGQVRPRCRKAP